MKLKELKRFIVRQGKIPIGKWQDSSNWLSYESALQKSKIIKDGGVSVVLGKINEEYTLAGIDLDTIQDKSKGIIDYEIQKDIEPFKHKHDSLSGCGIHILCLVKNNLKLDNGNKKHIASKIKINRLDDTGNLKLPEIEFYINNKVFALPISLNTDLDDIVDGTSDYINLYKKYFGNTSKSQSNEKSESEKDFAFFMKLIKKGWQNTDEMKKAYIESDLFHNKDEFHKRKAIERPDYLDRTIAKAFITFEEKQEEKGKNQINGILELIKDRKIFIDERDTAYIIVDYKNIKIESKKFEQFLTFECFENNVKINPQIINNVKSYLIYRAIKDKNKYHLNVRFAGNEKTIYYQLNEEDIVKITPNNYEIIKNDVPMFKWVNMLEQVHPQISDITFKNLLLHFNIEEKQRLLFITYLVSLFVPNIPKPILIFSAERGSGKTTATKLIKSLVDPSNLDTTGFPRDLSEFSLLFERNGLICFDNLDKLQAWQSDALCRAYSGEAISKKKLYTDEEDIVFQYKRAIILNGINCPATREDILDRSILINLTRIKDYKEERIINREWNALKPQVLDLIFKTLSKALQIYDTTELKESARSADWLKWSYCIAESIETGYGNKFLNYYKENVANQNSQVIENNPLVQAVIQLMDAHKERSWQGTATKLYETLKTFTGDYGTIGFPKHPSWLTRYLKSVVSVLESQNIKIEFLPATNQGSNIRLTKI